MREISRHDLQVLQKRSLGTSRKGPEPVADVLARLFTARGWARKQEHLQLEQAWDQAAGKDLAGHTRARALRRGVLEVEVDNATLLAELTHFHKRRLLGEIRKRLPEATITDVRFRAGSNRAGFKEQGG